MTYPGGRQDVGVWRGTKLVKLKFAIQEASFDPWSLHPLSSCHSLGSPDLKSRGKYGPMGPLEVSLSGRSWFYGMSLSPLVSKLTPFAKISQLIPWMTPFLTPFPSPSYSSFSLPLFPLIPPSGPSPLSSLPPFFSSFLPPLPGGFPGTDSGSC